MTKSTKGPLFAEVHNVPDNYHFTAEELERIIAGDMFTPRQAAIMARELQERRKALQDKDLQGVLGALEHPAGINAAGKQVVRSALVELQERRKADSEPAMYVMGMGQALDAETASTCKGAVDSWVAEWNQSRLPGQADYKTVPLYRHAHPAPVALKDHQMRELVNQLRDTAIQYHGTQQLREQIARVIRAVMLQAGRHPEIPDAWIPVSERMPEREVDVQVYCSDKKEQMVGYLERNEQDGYFRYATWRTGDGIYCQPTHWMPLPAAPQERMTAVTELLKRAAPAAFAGSGDRDIPQAPQHLRSSPKK